MPSNYAHYRFGAELLPQLPEDVQRTVKRFRGLYDVGLHGPDLFFYYSPLTKTKIGGLGHSYHLFTGAEFFQRSARRLRLDPSDAGIAYLYGVLGHYCLDSAAHPSVNGWNDAGRAGHVEIEVEFDRYLLELDGKSPAYTQDLSPHLHLGPGACDTIAEFYPPATGRHIRQALKNMIFVTKTLTVPDGARRTLVKKVMGLGGPVTQIIMGKDPNPNCLWAPEEMMPLYRQAAENFPVMARELQAHMEKGTPLGPLFQRDFG